MSILEDNARADIFFEKFEDIMKKLVENRDALLDLIKDEDPDDVIDVKGAIDTLDGAIHILTSAYE